MKTSIGTGNDGQGTLFPLADLGHDEGYKEYLKFVVTQSNSRFTGAIPIRRNVKNGWMLKDLTLAGPWGIPLLAPSNTLPVKLMAFSEAIRCRSIPPDTYVHFYEDDVKFERIWTNPKRCIKKPSKFAGIIGTDFSLYDNMPPADKIHNTYKNQLLSAHMQKLGFSVIPNVRISGIESIPYTLAGIPEHSLLALGLHGCIKNRENRARVVEEVRIICEERSPSGLVIYGSDAYDVSCYAKELNIPTFVFKPDTYNRSAKRAV